MERKIRVAWALAVVLAVMVMLGGAVLLCCGLPPGPSLAGAQVLGRWQFGSMPVMMVGMDIHVINLGWLQIYVGRPMPR